LLDVVAEGNGAALDAAFLASGYDKLGAVEPARRWLARAMEGAVSAGLFAEAAEFGDRLSALTESPEARAGIELDVVRALVRGRSFEEAKRRLSRVAEGVVASNPGGGQALGVRLRILRLEAARGLREPPGSAPGRSQPQPRERSLSASSESWPPSSASPLPD